MFACRCADICHRYCYCVSLAIVVAGGLPGAKRQWTDVCCGGRMRGNRRILVQWGGPPGGNFRLCFALVLVRACLLSFVCSRAELCHRQLWWLAACPVRKGSGQTFVQRTGPSGESRIFPSEAIGESSFNGVASRGKLSPFFGLGSGNSRLFLFSAKKSLACSC